MSTEQKVVEFETVDWTKKEDILQQFPRYEQEKIAMARMKNVTKNVEIEPFTIKAPISGHYLLKDARLAIESGKRYCLIGDAGCGKSTLFHDIARGAIKDFPKHLHVYHCAEIEVSDDATSVIEHVVRSHEFRTALLKCDAKLKEVIAAGADAESMTKLKDNLEMISLYLNRVQAHNAYERASKMLRVLGFDDEMQNKNTNALSGGLRMRVALCSAFFTDADLLLLDEPTNHLDFPSVLWLENRLRAYKGAFILICHDRDLLNNVCTAVMQIEAKAIQYYMCGFAEYEKRVAAHNKKKAEDIEKFLQKHRNVDFTSPLAKEKAEKQAWADYWYQKQIMLAGKFTFPDIEPLPDTPAGGETTLIDVKECTFSYNPDTNIWIFKEPINFRVTTATRMGVMGPNGAGKSTLLKLITRRLVPTTGTVDIHPTATVAYFAQHTVMDLNLEMTALEYMNQCFPDPKTAGQLRGHLAKVGIVGAKAETRMKSLSAGQRSCVVFARITFKCPHLLIMDEPTNFLDMESVDALIAAANKYKGALLLVSHSRAFLLKCARQYLSVVPGQFNIYDDLKTCERATYKFIEEMEAGVKVSGSNLVAQNPTVRGEQAAADASKPKGPIVFGRAPVKPPTPAAAPAAPKPAAAPAAAAAAAPAPAAAAGGAAAPAEAKEVVATNVGRKCTAVWAEDGAKYAAVITKDLGNGDIEVSYTGYNTTAVVKLADVVFKAPHAQQQQGGQAKQHHHEKHHGQQAPKHHGQQHQGGQRQQQQSRQTGQRSGAHGGGH